MVIKADIKSYSVVLPVKLNDIPFLKKWNTYVSGTLIHRRLESKQFEY